MTTTRLPRRFALVVVTVIAINTKFFHEATTMMIPYTTISGEEKSSVPTTEDNGDDPLSSIVIADSNISKDKEDLDLKDLPLPVQVLRQYQRWHGKDALLRDPHNRKFAISYYSCPHSAGNRLHEVTNDLMFSILTNRTMLIKCYDAETCAVHGKQLKELNVPVKIPWKNCREVNTVEDCEQSLHRRPWIPDYNNEWRSRLGLPDNQTFVYVKHGSDLNNHSHHPITMWHHEANTKAHSTTWPTPWGERTARDLFHLGTHFAYGAAFHALFSFSDPILDSKISGSHTNSTNEITPRDGNESSSSWRPFSVAVHSRNTDPSDDGCNVEPEMKCLSHFIPQLQQKQDMMQQHQQQQHSCSVFIMADRNCTLTGIASEVSKTCSVHIAARHEEKGAVSEHGPFAGSGYFHDLYQASAGARDAVVAASTHKRRRNLRTSSLILAELIEYNRKMEVWHSGQEQNLSSLPDIEICTYLQLMTPQQTKYNIEDGHVLSS